MSKQAAVLRAEGDREARILQAEGQAKAIQTVFYAIHAADPDPKVLAYQYLQALPQIAAGASNKIWIIPAELTKALEGIGGALTGILPGNGPRDVDVELPEESKEVLNQALEEARKVAAETEKEALLGLPAGERVTAAELLGQVPAPEREQA